MIVPSRWFAGGRGLDEFRSNMLSDKRIHTLVDFESSKDCFTGVDIAGGICYFLWDRDKTGPCNVVNMVSGMPISDVRDLDEFPVFIRSNKAIKILRKVLTQETKFMDSHVLSQKPFGFRTYARGESNAFPGAVRLLSSNGWGYVKRGEVEKNADLIDKYKLIVGRLVPSNGELDVKPGDGYRVITNTKKLYPGEINTESYITIGVFDTEEELDNYNVYIKSKLPRFLLRQAVSSVNINREVFKFVPMLDFTEKWDDAKLYKRYGLTDDEIEYVEQTIRMHKEDDE